MKSYSYIQIDILSYILYIIIQMYTQRFILKNQLTQLWELTSLESIRQNSRQETQVGFLCQNLEAKLFSKKRQVLLLRTSPDWMRPIHTIEGNLYLKKIINVNHMYKIPPQQHRDQCLTKHWAPEPSQKLIKCIKLIITDI